MFISALVFNNFKHYCGLFGLRKPKIIGTTNLMFFFSFFILEGKKDDVESGPEEEEVPTRGFLKRQANMIVDAKSRSKRGSRRR